MAAFKLPRLKANLAIVNGKGQPLDYFLRFWNIEVAPRIEQQEASQNEVLEQIQQLQAVQAQQLILINEALELAGIAIGLSGGNNGTSTATADVAAAWVLGPQVDLTGVVAGDLTIPGSGLFATSATRAFLGTTQGEMRLVEIVGGVETVIGGPWVFEAERVDPNPAGPVYISNDALINTFSPSLSTTGSVSYRLDARVTTPSYSIQDVNIKLYVRRTM